MKCFERGINVQIYNEMCNNDLLNKKICEVDGKQYIYNREYLYKIEEHIWKMNRLKLMKELLDKKRILRWRIKTQINERILSNLLYLMFLYKKIGLNRQYKECNRELKKYIEIYKKKRT